MRTAGAGGLRSAFVGREAELDLLRSLYRRTVEEGRPRLVTVTGDAGVGKTRLTRELWEWLADRTPEPLRRTGRCLPYGRGTTYRPLADVLREQLGLLRDGCRRDGAAAPGGPRDPRPHARPRRRARPAPARRPRAAADSVGRPSGGARRRAARRHARRGSALGAGAAARPARAAPRRRARPAARVGDGAAGAAGDAGRPGARRRDAATIWLEPLSPGRFRAAAGERCSRTTRPPSCGGPRSTAPRATRSSSRSSLAGVHEPASLPLEARRARLRAGRARRPDRPAPAEREGGAPGRRRSSAGSSGAARCASCSTGRAGLRAARGPRLHPAPVGARRSPASASSPSSTR